MDEFNNKNTDAVRDSDINEKNAVKYCFLREKIFSSFKRGKRILKISKIVSAVIFLLFTVIGIAVGHRTGHELLWLQLWILLIFLDVTVFVIADYNKYLIESKVIPYLNDDDQIEFGEYDIFLDDDETDEEEEEEEEEEE